MSRLERLAPFAGVVAVALLLAEFIVTGSTPSSDDPAQKVVSYYRDNATVQRVASTLFELAAVAFVWFGASLRQALRRAGGGRSILPSTAFAGTVILAVGLTVYAGFGLAAQDSAGDVPAAVTQTLNVLNTADMFVTIAVGNALMLLSVGISVLHHGGLPTWIGWVSVVLAVVSVTPVPWVSFLALVPLVPVLAILIYRRQPA